MSFKKLMSACLLAGTLAVSCSGPSASVKAVVPYVSGIIADRNSTEAELLNACRVPQRDGAVFVIGEESDCRFYASALTGSDRFDNVDGSSTPDGLPDFSGETICSIVDHAGGKYSSYVENGLADSLRTHSVRLALLAIDTLCYMSPYDLKGLTEQPRAKVILFASSYADGYGMYDVDSLFHAFGCKVPVINPLSEMKKVAFSGGKGRHVAVLAPTERLSAGLYRDCYAFVTPRDGKDPLLSLLDSYAAAGYNVPLDALIVDDLSISCDSLSLSLARIRSVMNEESLTYSRYISENFRIIAPEPLICNKCASVLRKGNLYTHRISFPKNQSYMTVRRPELVLIPYNERYAPHE